MKKEILEVLKEAQDQGWRVVDSSKGWMLYPPDRSQGPVAVHGTPSDRRALSNMIAEMRRRGFRWPAR